MRGALVVYRRELAALFVSPIGWVLLALALALNSWGIFSVLQQAGGDVNFTMQVGLGGGFIFWALMALLPPLLTMRTISEESRTGLLEFLLTAPVRDAAVVLGKALAATTFMVVLWSTVPLIGVVLALLGAAPDWGLVFTCWLGAVLISALFCAIGVVASAMSGTPLLAAFLALIFEVGLLLVRQLEAVLPPHYDDLLERVMPLFDLFVHVEDSFVRGAFDSASVVFFVAWTAVLLFLATRLVEARRWL